MKIEIRKIKGRGAYCMHCKDKVQKLKLEKYKEDPENYCPKKIEDLSSIKVGDMACYIKVKNSTGCLCLECAANIFIPAVIKTGM